MQTPYLLDSETITEQYQQPRFRADQFFEWLFEKRVFDPDAMSNLSKDFRAKLKETIDWSLPKIVSKIDSPDGATKLLLTSGPSQSFEAVILRYENRTSLCVSSQVGCKLACTFCQTGKLGFFRNLSVGEILGQFVLANNIVRDEGRAITHVVFMGMGEPLNNYDNVIAATNVLTKKFGLSHRRVTVSTSGIVSKIEPLSKDTRVALAVSLHACRDELRTDLMPINRRYPLAELKAELLKYQKTTGDPITFEYILIKDKNCGLREAKELVKFVHGFRAKINLIPFNAHPGMPFARPDEAAIKTFQSYLSERGIPAPVRYSKGLAISAACGQLAAKQKEQLDNIPKRASVTESALTVV